MGTIRSSIDEPVDNREAWENRSNKLSCSMDHKLETLFELFHEILFSFIHLFARRRKNVIHVKDEVVVFSSLSVFKWLAYLIVDNCKLFNIFLSHPVLINNLVVKSQVLQRIWTLSKVLMSSLLSSVQIAWKMFIVTFTTKQADIRHQ